MESLEKDNISLTEAIEASKLFHDELSEGVAGLIKRRSWWTSKQKELVDF